MSAMSGVLALARAIRAFFEARGTGIVVGIVGKGQRARRDNQAPGGAGRVLLVTDDSDGGEVVRGYKRFNPRASLQQNEKIKLCIWAADPANRNDEEAQIEASECLRDLVFEAIEKAVDPNTGIAIGAGLLKTPIAMRRAATQNQNLYFGLELEYTLTLRTLILQTPLYVATPTSSPSAAFSSTPLSPPPVYPESR
jgi:hypothetical protein